MFGKRPILIAALASVALIALVAGCGSSKDHSSEWNSEQTAQLKQELSEKAPEFTPTGIDCIVEAVEPDFSPTEGEPDDATLKKVEGIAKKCAETPANVQGVLSQACQEEGVLGERCQEEMINQYSEEFGFEEDEEEPYAQEPGYEEETYAEEPGYENEGLREMDEELQQEYEEAE